MKKRGIDIRVMWDDSASDGVAKAVVSEIVKAMKARGYRVVRVASYRNRRNSGGRVYIRVEVEDEGGVRKRRGRRVVRI